MDVSLLIQTDGSLTALFTEVIDLAGLGLFQSEQASNVEPDNTGPMVGPSAGGTLARPI